MKLNAIVTLFFLSSCAIMDGYRDNHHAWFEKGLSVEEKARIQTEGYLYKWWQGPDREGMLFITPLASNSKQYNFVEVGEWKEEFVYESNGIKQGSDKRQTKYDVHGNILERKVWDKPKQTNEFYLLEEWKSSYKINQADTALLQHITTFHPNGNKESDFKLLVIDYRTNLSDRLKTKQKVDTAYYYNLEGKLIDKKFY